LASTPGSGNEKLKTGFSYVNAAAAAVAMAPDVRSRERARLQAVAYASRFAAGAFARAYLHESASWRSEMSVTAAEPGAGRARSRTVAVSSAMRGMRRR
jgi:hypothetical protein